MSMRSTMSDRGPTGWEGDDLHLNADHDSPRDADALLCLNQPLGGDSAYTAFHHARLDPNLDALGSR